MDSFDYGKALSEMWTLGGKAFLEAQQQALRAMREGAAAMGLPTGTPGAAMSGGLPGAAMPGVGRRPPFRTSLSTRARSARRARRWPISGHLRATSPARWRGGCRHRRKAPMRPSAPPPRTATLRRMIDPRVWLSAGDDMEEALQRMAQGPRFADLWDSERRYAKVFQAWMMLRRRGLEHQAVVLEGWTTAARRFAERLGGLSARSEAPASPRAPRSTSGSRPRTGRSSRCSARSATSARRRSC